MKGVSMKDIEEIKEDLKKHSFKIDSSYRNGQDRELMRICGIAPETKGKMNLPVLVSERWVTGGKCGGNCWGDTADSPVETEDESSFESLDNFLEDIAPELTFIEYRKLVGKIQYGDYTQGEYYGNYYEYSFKYIKHEDLIEFLESINEDKKTNTVSRVPRSR